jgi:hypothetical protein
VAEPIVVNTGPLVSFARIGCLDVIGGLPYEFLRPAEVWQELDEGSAAGHPWTAPAWLKKKPLVKPPSPALLAGLSLRALIDHLEAGDSLEVFLRSFPSVGRDQAVAAIELAGELLAETAHSHR